MTPIYVVDAFTDRPFAGNPAGVCVLEQLAPEAWMQAVASEMKHSETAFVVPPDTRAADENETGAWGLRWFTPSVEVELCGHATLAAAHVLWSTGRADGPVRFATRSGVLGAQPVAGGGRLDFPALPADPADPPPGLVDALGVVAVGAGRSRFDWLVEVVDPGAVVAVDPDLEALRALSTVGDPVRGVIVTAAGGDDADFTSRFFAPAVGVDEDPVTGSAHTVLGPWWAARFDRTRLRAHQASARGGRLIVEVDPAAGRVGLVGSAVTMVAGDLRAEPLG